MNKQQKIAEWKRIASTAKDLESVAEQLKHLAARLGSEAASALELLAAKPERARKGSSLITEEMRLKLIAGLTNTGNRKLNK